MTSNSNESTSNRNNNTDKSQPVENMQASKNAFQAVRIDQAEPQTGVPHQPQQGRKEKIPAGGHTKKLLHRINSEIQRPQSSQREEKSTEHVDLVTKQSSPVIEKMKLFQDLNHFLDELNFRIKDLESRENYVSHSLLLLDHERRSFRLWKSQELMELDQIKKEWQFTNYTSSGIVNTQDVNLTSQDINVIHELKGIPKSPHRNTQVSSQEKSQTSPQKTSQLASKGATQKASQRASQSLSDQKPVIQENAKPSNVPAQVLPGVDASEINKVTTSHAPLNQPKVLKEERIYILDIAAEQNQSQQNAVSSPEIRLPDRKLPPVESGVPIADEVRFAEPEESEVEKCLVSCMDKVVVEYPPEIHPEVEVTEQVSNLSNSTEMEIDKFALDKLQTSTLEQISPNTGNAADEQLVKSPVTVEVIPEGYISQEEFLSQQKQWEELREQQLEDLERRQKLSLKQIRFQKEHLEKLRREFEIERNESLFELQQIQNRLQESATVLDMQQNQYRHARLLLDERYSSALREELIHRELSRLAREQHQQAEIEVEYIFSLEERLKTALSSQEEEFKRQQDQLNKLKENLTPGLTMMSEMQAEVENTQRETLLIREALERAWKQIKSDEQFPALEEAYQLNQITLNQNLEFQFAESFARLEKMNQQHTELLSLIDESLRTNLEVLEVIRKELPMLIPPVSDLKADPHEISMTERQLWLEEKLDAERIIRQLIEQLEDRLRYTFNENQTTEAA